MILEATPGTQEAKGKFAQIDACDVKMGEPKTIRENIKAVEKLTTVKLDQKHVQDCLVDRVVRCTEAFQQDPKQLVREVEYRVGKCRLIISNFS